MKTYAFYDPMRHWVKIGRSNDVARRLATLRAASGADLVLLGVIDKDREAEFHRALGGSRIRGEWFTITASVRQMVEVEFRAQIPMSAIAQLNDPDAVRRDALDYFQHEWGIELVDPEDWWFMNLEVWLAEEHGLGFMEHGLLIPDEDAQAMMQVWAEWPHRILAVGGDLDGGPLGMVLHDNPTPSAAFDEALVAAFAAIDSCVEFHIGVASSPPYYWPKVQEAVA